MYQIFLFLDQLFDDSNIGILSKFNFIHILEFPATIGKSQPSMSLLMYYQIMAKSQLTELSSQQLNVTKWVDFTCTCTEWESGWTWLTTWHSNEIAYVSWVITVMWQGKYTAETSFHHCRQSFFKFSINNTTCIMQSCKIGLASKSALKKVTLVSAFWLVATCKHSLNQ